MQLIHDWTSMQKTIIKYYDLATASKSKLKVVEEKKTKLKEEMTILCKSCDARIVEKEKILSKEHGRVADTLSKMD